MVLEQVREIVIARCKGHEYDLDFHIQPVVKYAKLLARKLNADEEVVEIAAWLHDISRIGRIDYEHHVTSAAEAEKILAGMGYPKEKISKVKHCILAHRSSNSIPRETVEAECVASADAMSHIDNVPFLFYIAFEVKKLGIKDGEAWVREKIERSWNKLMPEAKEIIAERYENWKKALED